MGRRPGEFDLISRHFAPLAGAERVLALGLTDDAAILKQAVGQDLVVTADALVAGVHFLPADPADLVARKALRVNLSDLAAKGARPLAYLVCLSLPASIDEPWIAAFAAGLGADQAEFGIAMAGGDTTSTPGPLTIAITAIGEVRTGEMRRRAGAKLGDEVWVSGSIGDAALGLRALRGDGMPGLAPAARAFLVDRYRIPRPRLALGLELPGDGIAAMDVSDGLVQDLGHILRLAGCGAVLNLPEIPLSPAASAVIGADAAALDQALSGGDDYELLLVAPPELGAAIQEAGMLATTPVRRIGVLVEGDGVVLRAADGAMRRLARGGWTHF
jgi:thiamine-monophosphate kinase